jgi:hypothetical protein
MKEERNKASFDIRAMTYLLDGGKSATEVCSFFAATQILKPGFSYDGMTYSYHLLRSESV